MSPVLAAIAAGTAVLLAFAPLGRRTDLRVLLFPVAGLGGWAALGLGSGLRWPLILILALATFAVFGQLRAGRARSVTQARADAVIEVCEGLAADLRAGQPPLSALGAAAQDWPEFGVVADAGRLGGDVPAALRTLAEKPGARGLRAVAAAWVLAHRSGAGLADAVALAARSVRDERAVARVVETEMSSARATAKLLALLPVGVLLIGRGAGGDPLGFLISTPAGLGCLGAGLALSWAGLTWLDRIARSVQT